MLAGPGMAVREGKVAHRTVSSLDFDSDIVLDRGRSHFGSSPSLSSPSSHSHDDAAHVVDSVCFEPSMASDVFIPHGPLLLEMPFRKTWQTRSAIMRP